MSVTPLPKGFKLAVAEAAIKAPGRNDMALIASENDSSMAGAFTTNKIKAAPVVMDMVKARRGFGRAIVINSGNANACTGMDGMRDARGMSEGIAMALRVNEQHVFACSTGVIGVPMPMKKVRPALERLVQGLGNATVEDVARAIMTTDTFPKMTHRIIKIGDVEATITAVCKGAGMIEPNMATMLCFFMSDLAVDDFALKAALKSAVDKTFNMLTVDGECSTNDTVLMFANGKAGNFEIKKGSSEYETLERTLEDMCRELSRMIARDGEGATKLVEITLKGAMSRTQAVIGAKAIANSLLVKTAIHGGDPNWGRIISALGCSGIRVDEEKVSISIGKVQVASNGMGTGKEKKAAEELQADEIAITVDIALGKAEATVITCDLSEQYIKINADYTT